MMESPLPVIVQGVGPIGAGIVQAVAADPGFALRGAVDIDPALVGQDALELAEAGRGGPTVRASLAEARDAAGVAEAIVLQATGSYLDAVAPQVGGGAGVGAAHGIDLRGAVLPVRTLPRRSASGWMRSRERLGARWWRRG